MFPRNGASPGQMSSAIRHKEQERMPSTSLPNSVTTAIATGLKAHLRTLGIDIKHTDLLAGIARGLGFASINAMRALGRSPAETEIVPEFSGTPAGFRTRFLVEVISDEDDVASITDLDEIHYEITSGGSVGQVSHLETTPLDREEMSAECVRMASDPDFFFGHETAAETEEEEDERVFIIRALFHHDGEIEPAYETTYRCVAANEKEALAKAEVRSTTTSFMKRLSGTTVSLEVLESVTP